MPARGFVLDDLSDTDVVYTDRPTVICHLLDGEAVVRASLL